MRARRQRSGRVFYYLDTGGRPRREIPLGADYVEAVRQWAELTRDKSMLPAHGAPSFRQLAEAYFRDVVPLKAPRTQRDNLAELAWLFKFFDNPPAPIDQIEPSHVRQYLDWRGKVAKTRANRERALFSAIWNHARNSGLTTIPNPCQGVRGFRERGRAVYVTDDVFFAVYVQAGPGLADAMALAYLTGQRPADVLAFRVEDIVDGALCLAQGKTGKSLRLRLFDAGGDPFVLGLLVSGILAKKAAAPVASSSLVCGPSGRALTYSALVQAFGRARKSAAALARSAGNVQLAEAVEAFQFRDLRAKAGTDVADDRGLHTAQRQLGHRSVKMTEVYVRLGDLVDPTK